MGRAGTTPALPTGNPCPSRIGAPGRGLLGPLRVRIVAVPPCPVLRGPGGDEWDTTRPMRTTQPTNRTSGKMPDHGGVSRLPRALGDPPRGRFRRGGDGALAELPDKYQVLGGPFRMTRSRTCQRSDPPWVQDGSSELVLTPTSRSNVSLASVFASSPSGWAGHPCDCALPGLP